MISTLGRALALGIAFASAALAAPAATTAPAPGDTMIVLDASGSMWAQIAGKTKMDIARSVLGELVAKLPAEKRVGLVTYGHREKANCKDIEQIAAVGTDRAAIVKAAGVLNPKGKTPVSDSVIFAAEKLDYTHKKASVVLVSDGQETCGKDPCAVGRALEAAGVDLTVHIVGFGLESATEAAGLRCLAEATGGRYIDAKNAGELTKALNETVAAKAPEPPKAARVILRATELDGGPEITTGLTWTLKMPGTAPAFTKANAGLITTEIAPGDYDIEVVRASDGQKKAGKVSALAGAERTVTIAFDLNLKATLALKGEAPAGSEVSIAWTGPNRPGDYITVVEKGAQSGAYKDWAYTTKGNPVTLRLSSEPGDYEARYMLGRPDRILAAVPIKAAGVQASLTAPDQAAAGSKVKVGWTGPGYKDDWITVVAPGAEATAYKDYFYAKDNPGEVTLPLEPGPYELRYVTGNKVVIAKRAITVVAVGANITAPKAAAAGSEVTITFAGPRTHGDWVTVVPKGSAPTDYRDYFDADRAAPYVLQMPLESGAHEIRYVQGGQKILVAVPIELTPVSAKLTAPPRAKAGTEIDVTWQGPNYKGDWLTVTKPSDGETTYNDYADTTEGSPLKLKMPAAPGTYELRYVARGKKVIGRSAIEVTP